MRNPLIDVVVDQHRAISITPDLEDFEKYLRGFDLDFSLIEEILEELK